jgi:hypothetical protein
LNPAARRTHDRWSCSQVLDHIRAHYGGRLRAKELPSNWVNAGICDYSPQDGIVRVGGQKATLAWFRQVIEEPLIAEDSTLNGDLIGWINYHPDQLVGVPRGGFGACGG